VTSEDRKIDANSAPLVEHLVEFRRCLIASLVAFFIAFMICFMIKDYILDILLLPYQWAMKFFNESPENIRLQSTQVLETFLTKLKISAFGGVILAFPYIAFQFYCFIAPGLYKNERIMFLPFLIATPVLFLIGAAVVYCLIAPFILWFSLSQQIMPNGHFQIEFVAKISEYLDFMTSFILSFGLIFQLPVATSILTRVGFLTSDMLVSVRRLAIVVIFVMAAMITPIDLFSMFGLAFPTILLYEISIFLARRIEKKQR